MKLLFENWRNFLLVEDTFADVEKRIRKPLTKFIKARIWDPVTKTLKMTKPEITYKADLMATSMVDMIHDDIEDKNKALALQWLITRGLKDERIAEFVWTSSGASRLTVRNRHVLEDAKFNLEKYFLFRDFAEKKDIFEITSLDELERQTEAARVAMQAHQKKKAYLDAEEGTEILRDDDKMAIYVLHNKGAACRWGTEDWCTAAPGGSAFAAYYRKDDPLFYFEDKTDGSKYQFHFGSKQFKDAKDIDIILKPPLGGYESWTGGERKRANSARKVLEMIQMLIDTGASKKYPIIESGRLYPEAIVATHPEDITLVANEVIETGALNKNTQVIIELASKKNLPEDVSHALVNFYFENVTSEDDAGHTTWLLTKFAESESISEESRLLLITKGMPTLERRTDDTALLSHPDVEDRTRIVNYQAALLASAKLATSPRVLHTIAMKVYELGSTLMHFVHEDWGELSDILAGVIENENTNNQTFAWLFERLILAARNQRGGWKKYVSKKVSYDYLLDIMLDQPGVPLEIVEKASLLFPDSMPSGNNRLIVSSARKIIRQQADEGFPLSGTPYEELKKQWKQGPFPSL
jgi:hypothetical protein